MFESKIIESFYAVDYIDFTIKLLCSTVIGAVIAFHALNMKNDLKSPKMVKIAKAKILLCMAGTIMVIVIGDSVARAFGLFGLGSFIRFRTAIKDATDTAIIFVLIAIGMAIGVGFYGHAVIVSTFLYIIIFILGFIKPEQDDLEEEQVMCDD